jgi:putative MATE family efflux protein
MAKNATREMTSGSPVKLILSFAVPLLLGMLFQQFYSMVDTIIVGKSLGVDQLAGVGSTGAINFMIIGFCNGVCSGFAIPIAQSFGAKDYKRLRKFVANAAWLSIAFAAVMTVVVCVLCRQILFWMDTPENIFEYAYSYIFIIFLGIPATYLYNLLSGIIRSLGDSRTPVIFLVISAMLNIIFDLLAILVLHMGGAAWATVLSQLISGILCFLYMRKQYDILRFEKDEIKFEGRQAIILCNMGIPMGLQYSITAIGSVILQTAVNSLGSQAVAAVTAAGRISGFSCCPFDALGSTMATYAGQNVGAGKLDRVGKGLKSASFIGGIYAIIAFFVLSLFGRQIALLFVSADEIAILDHVKQFLVFNTAFYIPLCLVNTVRFCIQGMGYSRLAILAGVCEMVGRIIASLVLVPLIGFVGICLASPIAWIMADLFLVPAYCHTINRMKKILAS